MPPPSDRRSCEKSSLANSALFSSALNSVLTAGKHVELVLRQFLDEARNVARVGDQHVQAADAHAEQAARRQREDVIQRQRGDADQLLGGGPSSGCQRRLHPGLDLQHVGDDVAVQQRRALGRRRWCRRCTAGRRRRRASARPACSFMRAAVGEHVVEADRARQLNAGTIFFTLRTTKLTSVPLAKPSRSPIDATHHVLDLRARQHLLQRGGEVLEDEDRLRRPNPSAGARVRAACTAD